MKKNPIKKYEKLTCRRPFVGTMADESRIRYQAWLKYGCNSFEKVRSTSTPLAFWTDQDIYQYILKYNLPYASVYGDIVPDNGNEEALKGQISIYEALDEYEGVKLKTTGMYRTGCMFCCFACHLDRLGENGDKNRFQLMKETHPNQYAYCMKPIEEGGLGLKQVLEYINVPYE